MVGEVSADIEPEWPAPEPADAVAEDGRIHVADGRDYQIVVVSPEGDTLRIVRALVERIPVTDADHRAAIEREREYWDSIGISRFGEDFAAASGAIGHLQHRPVTGSILVAPGGRILLERRDLDPDPSMLAPADTATWDLIDPDGRIAGRLEVPPRTRLARLTDTHAYGVEFDELDVPYVVRYRIEAAADDSGGSG